MTPVLPRNHEDYGVVHPEDMMERLLDGDVEDLAVGRHLCRVEDTQPLCDATIDEPEVYPFRGQRWSICAGLDECCPECVQALTALAEPPTDEEGNRAIPDGAGVEWSELFEADPEQLDHEELRRSWEEIVERLRSPPASSEQENRLYERRRELWTEMKSRVDAEPPECPECGAQSWSQTMGGPKHCDRCDRHPGADEMELIQAIDDYWDTVLSGPSEVDR